jgi:superoxide dismutase, Cu-Zn family
MHTILSKAGFNSPEAPTMPNICKPVLAFYAALALAPAQAQMVVEMHLIGAEAIGPPVGTVTLTDSQYGLLLTPKLAGLTAGLHGFHVHEHPSCAHAEKEGKAVAGLAAGGHFDPAKTGKHLGPYDDTGHLGDLPALYVAADGTATLPVLAPRLKVADVSKRALMIHAGGDNYSDQPAALGGGGARVACGVAK